MQNRIGLLRQMYECIKEEKEMLRCIENFEKEYPRIETWEFSRTDWAYLAYIFCNVKTCRHVIMKNLGKLDFVEAYFRLRVYELGEEKRNEFFDFLEKSRFQMIKTAIRINLLDSGKVRKWNQQIRGSDFDRVKADFPFALFVPNPIVDSITSIENYFLGVLRLFFDDFFGLLSDRQKLVNFLYIIGAFASILGFLYAFLS